MTKARTSPEAAPGPLRTERRELHADGRPGAAAAGPGRPRLTREELQARIADYCRRYGVAVNDEGLPPFPAGKRETEQHRQWMALYKAQRRLTGREREPAADLARRQELLTAQRGRCPVCRKPLDAGDARLDSREAEPAVLHASCRQLVELGRALGPEALERAKARL